MIPLSALFSISTAFRTWRCFRPVSVPVLISSPYARFKCRNFHKHVQNVMHAFELWLSVFTANLLLENATPENFIWFKLQWLIDHHSVTDPVKPCPVVLFSLPSDKPPGYLTHSVFLQGYFFAFLVTFYCDSYKTIVFRYSCLFKRSKKKKHYYHLQKKESISH